MLPTPEQTATSELWGRIVVENIRHYGGFGSTVFKALNMLLCIQ